MSHPPKTMKREVKWTLTLYNLKNVFLAKRYGTSQGQHAALARRARPRLRRASQEKSSLTSFSRPTALRSEKKPRLSTAGAFFMYEGQGEPAIKQSPGSPSSALRALLSELCSPSSALRAALSELCSPSC